MQLWVMGRPPSLLAARRVRLDHRTPARRNGAKGGRPRKAVAALTLALLPVAQRIDVSTTASGPLQI
jgi:hypothetical protein